MALGGPDTRVRMIAIKQQSGIPLTDKEVKRLAQRQSVEAMYARNGWSGNGGMQGAYNDASGHLQARSMANSIGRIQGEYGENAVAGVQKYNREDLIDRDRLNKANIEGRKQMMEAFEAVKKHDADLGALELIASSITLEATISGAAS